MIREIGEDMRFIIISLLCFKLLISQTNTEVNQAINLFKSGEFEQTKTKLLNVIDEDENNAEAFFYLALTYEQLKDPDEAVDYCEKATELNPNNIDYQFKLGQLYSMTVHDASIFSRISIAKDMRDAFKKVIELDPNHLEAQIGLARFYSNAPGIAGGDMDLAFKHAETVKQLNERRGHFIFYEIYESQNEYQKAEAELDIILTKYKSDKSLYSLYNTYGYLLLRQNKVGEAIQKFKKQIELRPDLANPYDSYAEALRKKGDLNESLAMYRKALSINPKLENAKQMIEEIEDELD